MRDQENVGSLKPPMLIRRVTPTQLFLAFVGLYLVFSTVWAPRFSTFRYENARWFELVLLTSAVLLLAFPGFAGCVFQRWSMLNRAPRILLSVALIGGALSAAVSPAVHFGAMEIGLMTQLVFFALCVACVVGKLGRGAERVLCVALVGGAGLLVLQFWTTRTLYLFENKLFSWNSPFLEFANVRFFSQYQAYTLLILPVCVAIFDLQRWQRYILYFLVANLWALQWMVGTRAVWAGLLLAVAAVLIFARGGRSKWLLQQILLIFSGALIFVVYLLAVPAVTADAPTSTKNSLTARGSRSADARITMAREAIGFVRARPLTGVGPGQFGLAYRTTLAAHPHNSVLQLLSEYGLIAGGAALGVAALLLMLAVTRLKPPEAGASDPIDICLSAALIMGLGDSLFSGNIVMPHSQILLSLLSGWLLARAMPSSASPAPQPNVSPAAVRMALGCSVLLAWAVTMILSLEYWHVTHTLTSWLPDRPPHFWQYGRLDSW